MKKNIVLVISAAVLVFSCSTDQSEIEKSQEKQTLSQKEAKADTEALLVQKEYSLSPGTTNQKESEQAHLAKVEAGRSLYKSKLNQILLGLNEKIDKEKTLLSELKTMPGNPTPDVQVKMASLEQRLGQFEIFLPKLEREITLTHVEQIFDFQNSPVTVVEYVFSAARSRDFSKLRHLLDPYGESGPQAQKICYLDMSTKEKQEQVAGNLENGKIVNEPTIVSDKAAIEYVNGSATEIQKLTLINRRGKWYLLN